MILFHVAVTFIDDTNKRMSVRPRHREFLQAQLDAGTLFAAGPRVDDAGGYSIWEVPDRATLDTLLAQDPYTIDGIFATVTVTEWNAVFTRS